MRRRCCARSAITLGQCSFLLNSRYLIDSSLSVRAHLENRFVAIGIGTVVLLQLLFTYFRPLQVLFGNESIPLHIWPVLLAGGLAFFLVIEVEKLIIRSSAGLRTFVTGVEADADAPGRAI